MSINISPIKLYLGQQNHQYRSTNWRTLSLSFQTSYTKTSVNYLKLWSLNIIVTNSPPPPPPLFLVNSKWIWLNQYMVYLRYRMCPSGHIFLAPAPKWIFWIHHWKQWLSIFVMWIRIGVDVCLWTAITIQESSLFCLHDWLYVFGFDEDGYRVESCHLQSLDGIPTDVQDTMLFLKKR